ncbi:hypothetical protein [Thermococcus sp.]|uniref:hypothetical protein n=1 Tax=Thermococcus sp. TaxID=35749 RepID=UPI0025E15CF8|nr:hypothetical protein [Thermococcus sp.]
MCWTPGQDARAGHEDQYDVAYTHEAEEAEGGLEIAGEFTRAIKKLMEELE